MDTFNFHQHEPQTFLFIYCFQSLLTTEYIVFMYHDRSEFSCLQEQVLMVSLLRAKCESHYGQPHCSVLYNSAYLPFPYKQLLSSIVIGLSHSLRKVHLGGYGLAYLHTYLSCDHHSSPTYNSQSSQHTPGTRTPPVDSLSPVFNFQTCFLLKTGQLSDSKVQLNIADYVKNGQKGQ